MNESRARELFLDFHRGLLSAEDATALRALLSASPTLRREFDEFAETLALLDTMPDPKPSPRLRAGVLAAIEAEKRTVRKTIAVTPRPLASTRRPIWFWLGQFAAAVALLVAGYVAGTRRPAAVPIEPPIASTESLTQREIAALRDRVESMQNQLESVSMRAQQRPTNDRLRAVLASASLENPSDRVIEELIGSLAADPSTNVRLTALEALYPHARLESVRAGVLASLPREQNPLVQVAMIDFLVAARDGISRGRRGRCFAEVIGSAAAREMIHPRGKAAIVAIRVPIFQHALKNRLGDILGGGALSGELYQKTVERTVMALEQFAQRVELAVAHGKHQLMVGS